MDQPIEDCLPHRAPALLVVAVAGAADHGGRVRITAGLTGLQLLEAMAQAVAAVQGAMARAAGGSERPSGIGVLGAVRQGRFAGQASDHASLAIVERGVALGPLVQWQARVETAAGEVIAEATITVAEGVG